MDLIEKASPKIQKMTVFGMLTYEISLKRDLTFYIELI